MCHPGGVSLGGGGGHAAERQIGDTEEMSWN